MNKPLYMVHMVKRIGWLELRRGTGFRAQGCELQGSTYVRRTSAKGLALSEESSSLTPRNKSGVRSRGASRIRGAPGIQKMWGAQQEFEGFRV